ncbi:MAG: hypothetical protein R3F54_13395 [Alphaproteobacteria bacterium]
MGDQRETDKPEQHELPSPRDWNGDREVWINRRERISGDKRYTGRQDITESDELKRVKLKSVELEQNVNNPGLPFEAAMFSTR